MQQRRFFHRKASAFGPLDEPSTHLWLDAWESNGYTVSGSALTSVIDKTGNYTPTINGDPQLETNVLNGRDAFRFDTSDSLTIGSLDDWIFLHNGQHTIFSVFESWPGNSDPNTVTFLLGTGDSSAHLRGIRLFLDDRAGHVEAYRILVGNGSNVVCDLENTGALSFDTPHLLYSWGDMANATAADRAGWEIDGTANSGSNSETGSVSGASPEGILRINDDAGGGNQGDLRLHELIICNDLLSPARVNDFQNYLSNKWGI